MSGARRAGLAAVLVWAVSWFLPAVDSRGDMVTADLAGWEAFIAALSPLFNLSDLASDPLRLSVWVVSALTNILVVAYLAPRRWLGARGSRALGVGLAAAAVLNLYWVVTFNFRELEVGYFAWAASFIALAVAHRLDAAGVPERVAAAHAGGME